MKSILGLLLMQVVIPSGEGMSVAQKIEVLAQSAARSAYTMLDLFEDETVRGEIKRVGLDQGCPLANRVVSNALAARHDDLLPMARKAVEGVIPASRLETMRPVTFMMGVGSIYRGRVMERLEVLAAAELSVIQKQASAFTLAGARALTDHVPSAEDKPVIPKVIEIGFGADPSQAFERPPLLSVACLSRARPPGNLRIESGGEVWPEEEQEQ